MEVRSDFRLALKVRDANGRTRTVGSFSHETDDYVSTSVVPHLQRVDPTGRWLASYDPDRRQIALDVVDGSAAKAHTIPIKGTLAAPHQFRWLDDGEGFVVSTEDQVYLLKVDPAQPGAHAEPVPLLANVSDHPLGVDDVRVMKDGLLVRIAERVPVQVPPEPLEFELGQDLLFGDARVARSLVWVGDNEFYEAPGQMYGDQTPANQRGQLLYIALADGKPTATHALVAPTRHVDGAIPLSGGRVAATVGPYNDEPWDYSTAEELWVATPSAKGWVVQSREDCDDCEATNWAPGADAPIFAEWSDIRVDGPNPYTLTMPGGGSVNVLWADSDFDLVIATSSEELAVWEGQALRWSYQDPSDSLHSARSDPSGRYLYTANDAEIRRFSLVDGSHKRMVKIKTFRRDTEQEGNEDNDWQYTTRTELRRLDGVVPLPNGGIAYAVLEAEEEASSAL